MIQKLLIANRGEIAVRVIRAARSLGIRTVAVYSDVDERQCHVLLADEAIAIGGSEPAASYLDAEKILDACRQTGADAVHPGYGFLSERAEFSEACANAGIRFVGPPASAMRLLGSKIAAKQLAVSVGAPITPGFFEPDATPEALLAAAIDIGFPVMLKASAGGGGRGMRVVREPDAFLSELEVASDEALKGFGDGTMMVEKLIERPRHIEVQLIADSHGTVLPLFERECSLQRRHQKIIEEAPSPLVAAQKYPELWPKLRDASIKLASAAGYVNAGTVEFMVDDATGAFYFLEVNARLQVEHPVTEAITALDLVRLQLLVAQGERLDVSENLALGDRSAISGHAIEARIVAEDPSRQFLPSIGRIVGWAEPQGPGIRVDTGYGAGAEVSRFYDSLLAKVIAHGATRAEAIARLIAALEDFHILGVQTNIAYLLDVLRHPGFAQGAIDTGFLGREFAEWAPSEDVPSALGAILEQGSLAAAHVCGEPSSASTTAWSALDDFRNAR